MSEYEPITAELRAALDVDREFMRADGTVVAQTFCVDRDDFDRCCDAIDAVHAGLERENAELRERVAVLDKECENMHDGMSITDELREWASIEVPYKYGHQLTSIADRIDAEHERQCAESWMRGHDAWAAIDRSDEMAEHGWIRLPKDADGETWNVSDLDEDGNTVIELRLTPSGWCVITDGGEFCLPSSYRHHHAPTVEDVLREMLYKAHVYDKREMELLPDLISEYAKRLTLVGDAE